VVILGFALVGFHGHAKLRYYFQPEFLLELPGGSELRTNLDHDDSVSWGGALCRMATLLSFLDVLKNKTM
jgi:hypothetical protein